MNRHWLPRVKFSQTHARWAAGPSVFNPIQKNE